MASPVLSVLTVVGSMIRDGRDYVSIDSPTMVRVLCTSSGTAAGSVRLRVSWGDDTESVADSLVGLEESLSHTYEDFGLYTISITAVNDRREVSQVRSVPVWVEKVAGRQRRLVRWRGLALPTTDSRITTTVQETGYQTTEFNIAVNAFADQTEVFVSGRTSGYVGAEFIISQPGRRYSSGRVVEAADNKLVLDTVLDDDYTLAARIELTQRSHVSSSLKAPDRESPWFFPISTDEDLIKAAMTVCFACRKMELLHLPDFGSDLSRMPFEPSDEVTAGLIEMELNEAASWEPRAKLEDIKVDLSGNTISVSSNVRYNGDSRSAIFNASIPLNLK